MGTRARAVRMRRRATASARARVRPDRPWDARLSLDAGERALAGRTDATAVDAHHRWRRRRPPSRRAVHVRAAFWMRVRQHVVRRGQRLELRAPCPGGISARACEMNAALISDSVARCDTSSSFVVRRGASAMRKARPAKQGNSDVSYRFVRGFRDGRASCAREGCAHAQHGDDGAARARRLPPATIAQDALASYARSAQYGALRHGATVGGTLPFSEHAAAVQHWSSRRRRRRASSASSWRTRSPSRRRTRSCGRW